MACLRQIAGWHIYEQQFSISIRLLMANRANRLKFRVICMLQQCVVYTYIE